MYIFHIIHISPLFAPPNECTHSLFSGWLAVLGCEGRVPCYAKCVKCCTALFYPSPTLPSTQFLRANSYKTLFWWCGCFKFEKYEFMYVYNTSELAWQSSILGWVRTQKETRVALSINFAHHRHSVAFITIIIIIPSIIIIIFIAVHTTSFVGCPSLPLNVFLCTQNVFNQNLISYSWGE